MRIAVKKFVSKTEKEPTDELLKLSLYYRFKFRFCNTCSGNEKGHVERSVEVVRCKAFSNKDIFSSLDEANEYLHQVCEKLNNTVQTNSQKSPLDLFLEEKQTLLPTFGKYEAAKMEMLRVDKYSTIMIDLCHYSVPDRLVNKIVKCKIYSNDIIVFWDNEKVAHHKKNHGKFQWVIDINHYITTLMRKPHALLNSSAFNQMNKVLEEIYNKYFTGKEKEFVQLLALVGEVGLDKVEKSISMISKITSTSITIDKIKFVCQKNENIDFYKNYLNDKESKIINNSVNMLNDYTQMLSERKDDVN
ncbi:Integrase catalytic region [human gut metagenome]|uniref:Integrase catalytic region n=1 Tax=human gut metagenome TaxID=408170 RepID=W1WK57_9ZZZZ